MRANCPSLFPSNLPGFSSFERSSKIEERESERGPNDRAFVRYRPVCFVRRCSVATTTSRTLCHRRRSGLSFPANRVRRSRKHGNRWVPYDVEFLTSLGSFHRRATAFFFPVCVPFQFYIEREIFTRLTLTLLTGESTYL